jgi:hypothetical protein
MDAGCVKEKECIPLSQTNPGHTTHWATRAQVCAMRGQLINCRPLVLWVVTPSGLECRHQSFAFIFTTDRGRGFFLCPLRPDGLWGPPSLLYSGYRGALSPGVKRGRGVMLTTHPLLVPRLRNSRSYNSSHPKEPSWRAAGPLYLHLNGVTTQKTNTDVSTATIMSHN